ncbi:MAG: hypothetical protein J7L96_06280, partial [Bacteroidales bacterium]|nr:hypothetical protein [Bacteroidales bacterium]
SNRADPDTVDIPVNVPFVLFKNAPNPFRESTSIRFDVAIPQRLEITIFDMKGYPVRKLMDADFERGVYFADWDGRDDYGKLLPPGYYIYRMTSPFGKDAWKMVLEY